MTDLRHSIPSCIKLDRQLASHVIVVCISCMKRIVEGDELVSVWLTATKQFF